VPPRQSRGLLFVFLLLWLWLWLWLLLLLLLLLRLCWGFHKLSHPACGADHCWWWCSFQRSGAEKANLGCRWGCHSALQV